MSDLPKVCLYCSNYHNGRCFVISENLEIEANPLTSYMEDGILYENIREGIGHIATYDIKDKLEGLVTQSKMQKVLKIINDYVNDNVVTDIIDDIDDSVSTGIVNNFDNSSKLYISNPYEFSCKYYR